MFHSSHWCLPWSSLYMPKPFQPIFYHFFLNRCHPHFFALESGLVEEIVKDVYKKLDEGQLFVADHPVGIESRVHELTEEWVTKGSQKALIIGLWGMGGLGKTTVAKAIHNAIGHHFIKKSSFLANIRENAEHVNGLVSLQQQLVSDIFKTEVFKIPNIDRGKDIIKTRFPEVQTLVVLDDVDNLSQVMAFYGNREWFCPGSVIIITTRDMHLLDSLEADSKYEVRKMDETESLELFSWHAFKQETPSKEFMELSKSVVANCGGLPLALRVVGSHLFGREIGVWDHVLSILERIPDDEIQSKLKISFDGLKDDSLKNIFLDICCFFINKDRNYVTQVLNGCGFNAEIGIEILIERSLINVNMHNKLEMHDLLRDMGRKIIRESPPKDPEDRSRLWFHEDVLDVLKGHVGTKTIEGISLKLPRTHRECLIDSEAFKAMRKLRLLQLDYNVNLKGDYKHIPKTLRWLCWQGFPLKSTPDNLYQENLVVIDFKYSNLRRVWKKPQLLQCLTMLILSHSHYLTRTPDFTKLPNLKKLVLKDCPSLMVVHESIGDLKNLLLINLKDCKCLKELPRSIYRLKSLKTLILSGCLKIDHLEEDIEQMESLTTLMADNTAITQAPRSLARLEGLVHGYVSLCGYEGRAQDIFPSLLCSWMSPTNIPQSDSETFLQSMSTLVFSAVQNGSFQGLSPFLGDLARLRGMWEEYRPQFRSSGEMARLLDALFKTDFVELKSTSHTPQLSHREASSSSESHDQVHIGSPTDSFNSLLVQMGLCTKADILKEKILQGCSERGFGDSSLPNDNHPEWLSFKGEGSSVLFEVPLIFGRSLKGMILCITYLSSQDSMTLYPVGVLVSNRTKATIKLYEKDATTTSEDEEWQNIISNWEPGNRVEVMVTFACELTVKKTAIYLVYDEDVSKRIRYY
ncbi:disease resistance protein RUN1-like isoform X2 [Prosopis cineraria]|uniref:disease resistance protein RUN1-like isoform X2 n=1 Tax=Prosopis cineraria TaxID=364024 RepID=UPI00240EC18E|nr:disease resistance protein RUN1-like isoform X2 [Prosopis cineraria]